MSFTNVFHKANNRLLWQSTRIVTDPGAFLYGKTACIGEPKI